MRLSIAALSIVVTAVAAVAPTVASAYTPGDPANYGSAPPVWCTYGAWSDNGLSFKTNGTTGSLTGSYYRLLVEGPERALVGAPYRIKADGVYYVDHGETVYFYSSSNGYLGSQKTNFEGNAYLTFTPPPSARQSTVWIMKGLDSVPPPCSMQSVTFQQLPTLSVTYDSNSYPMRATYRYSIDAYSKAYMTGAPVVFQLLLQGRVVKELTLPARQLVGTFTVDNPPIPEGSSGDGVISDGYFTARASFYEPYKIPLDCANACPESLGGYRTQCEISSAACGFRMY